MHYIPIKTGSDVNERIMIQQMPAILAYNSWTKLFMRSGILVSLKIICAIYKKGIQPKNEIF